MIRLIKVSRQEFEYRELQELLIRLAVNVRQLAAFRHQKMERRERKELLLRLVVNFAQLAALRHQKIVAIMAEEIQKIERQNRRELLIRLTGNMVRLAALRKQEVKQRAREKPRWFTRFRTASARLSMPGLGYALIEPAAVPVSQSTTERARHDLLTPIITAAQNECNDGFSTAEVWAVLVSMGDQGRPPLIGVTEDGIKWRNGADEVKFLTMKNLRDRLSRDKKRTR